jgi:hypothetical protein
LTENGAEALEAVEAGESKTSFWKGLCEALWPAERLPGFA